MIAISQIGNPRSGFRMGNSLFLYCTAKKIAQRLGTELLIPKTWIGLQLFDIEDKIVDDIGIYPNTEFDEIPDRDNINLWGYYQFQEALIYTRQEALSWLKFKSEVLKAWKRPHDKYVAIHQRLGDYLELSNLYAVPNTMSYYGAIDKAQIKPDSKIVWVSDGLNGNNDITDMIKDFLDMAYSDILIRSNSTFSYWAGVLGNPNKEIYAPQVSDTIGLASIPFVKGNWPMMASPKVHGTKLTDLYLDGVDNVPVEIV